MSALDDIKHSAIPLLIKLPEIEAACLYDKQNQHDQYDDEAGKKHKYAISVTFKKRGGLTLGFDSLNQIHGWINGLYWGIITMRNKETK